MKIPKTLKCKHCKQPKRVNELVEINGFVRKCCKTCYASDELKPQRKKDKASLENRKKYEEFYEENKRRRDTDYNLHMYARRRAKKYGIPFDIKISDVIVPEFCPVLGIKLKPSKDSLDDFSPTLDKIVPELGYVKGNVCVISNRANRIKSDGTIKEHEKIISYIQKHKTRLTDNQHPV